MAKRNIPKTSKITRLTCNRKQEQEGIMRKMSPLRVGFKSKCARLQHRWQMSKLPQSNYSRVPLIMFIVTCALQVSVPVCLRSYSQAGILSFGVSCSTRGLAERVGIRSAPRLPGLNQFFVLLQRPSEMGLVLLFPRFPAVLSGICSRLLGQHP